MDNEFDLAIIGAGPGGYVSAIRAAHHGFRVVLIEQKDLGGVCLHTGCIPTKTMVSSIGLLRQARTASHWGVNIPQAEAQLTAISARRQKVIQQLAKGIKFLLDKNEVKILAGKGIFKSPNEIEVVDPQGGVVAQIHQPKAILIATGSRPAELSIAPRDGIRILNSDDILSLQELPEQLVIVGGGYIGCEFASVFAGLGSRVTLIEGKDRLLPGMDPDLGSALTQAFRKSGIEVLLNTTLQSVINGERLQLHLSSGSIVTGDQLLVAIGRVPNSEKMGLETIGLQLVRGFIEVDEMLQTNLPHIFAIGDVTGKMPLAHVATAQGRVVVENLLAERGGGKKQRMNYDAVPACVFTYPEAASIGLSEDEARARGIKVRVGRFPFAAIGKALAMGETEGFVKLLAEEQSGKLVGGQIFGGHAAELIGQITLAVNLGATAQQVTETIFAHPTLSESILEAAEGLFGKPVHLFSKPVPPPEPGRES